MRTIVEKKKDKKEGEKRREVLFNSVSLIFIISVFWETIQLMYGLSFR